MSNESDDKVREVFRKSLTKARDELRALMADAVFPRNMQEDLLDILEHIEAVLEFGQTEDERDFEVAEAVKDLGK